MSFLNGIALFDTLALRKVRRRTGDGLPCCGILLNYQIGFRLFHLRHFRCEIRGAVQEIHFEYLLEYTGYIGVGVIRGNKYSGWQRRHCLFHLEATEPLFKINKRLYTSFSTRASLMKVSKCQPG